MIIGFDGWGNAMDISKGMTEFLIRTLKGKRFARLDPDFYYRYERNRPSVKIEAGALKTLKPPGGAFYALKGLDHPADVIILKADEPSLRWNHFIDLLMGLCLKFKVETLISLGSMYDSVLHTDRMISAFASSDALLDELKKFDVHPIYYEGPSAIHASIQAEAENRGLKAISIWCHCPQYLQGTRHYGLLSSLGQVLAAYTGLNIELSKLESAWQEMKAQIDQLVSQNPELQSIVKGMQKAKQEGAKLKLQQAIKKDEKVIHIEDFLDPK